MFNLTEKTKIIPAEYNHSLYNQRKYLIIIIWARDYLQETNPI